MSSAKNPQQFLFPDKHSAVSQERVGAVSGDYGWQRKSLPISICIPLLIGCMSHAWRTEMEDNTHIGLERRPRLPFLPMTGVPKCSGLVRGSLSSVCRGDKQQ